MTKRKSTKGQITSTKHTRKTWRPVVYYLYSTSGLTNLRIKTSNTHTTIFRVKRLNNRMMGSARLFYRLTREHRGMHDL